MLVRKNSHTTTNRIGTVLNFAIVFAIILATFLITAPALAANEAYGYPQNITISSPANGQTVGRVITIAGQANPGAALSVLIDGKSYIDPRDRGTSEPRDAAIPGGADGNGSYSFTINLEGDRVVNNEQGQSSGVSNGSHRLMVIEFYRPGRSNEISFTVQDGSSNTGQSVSQPQPAAATSATPSPSPSPSPVVSPPSAMVEGANSVSPWIALLVGGLIGAGLGAAVDRLVLSRRA